MNPLRFCHLLFGLLLSTICGQAQTLAPASLTGTRSIVSITSGSGFFASLGVSRLTMATTGNSFTLTALTNTVSPSTGNYVYTRTGATTAQITATDSTGVTIIYSLTFTTTTSANFAISNSLGQQRGIIVIENPVTTTTTPSAPAGLSNMSVRTVVPAGGQVIPGLVLDAPTRVLVRVAGPTLASFGVADTLPNPRLSLFNGTTAIASNDDWSDTAANQTAVQTAANRTGAFAFLAGSKDAAIVADLAAGSYTCLISGEGNTSGEVILEVYRVPTN